jgi:hypothetical protein
MTVPEFPGFRDVDLSFKTVVREMLLQHPLEASEYTFTNIFAFRLAYEFQLSRLMDNLIIKRNRDRVSFFSPVGNSRMPETMKELFGYLGTLSDHARIERVPESFVKEYLAESRDFVAHENRDNFDYLYDVRALIELKGRRFHDKKNHVNRFRAEHEYEYLALTPDLIEECIEFEHYWCEVRDCGKYPGLEKERCAILELLNNFESLDVKGGIIKTGGKIAALTVGEKLLPDTLVIHIEKAHPHIPGLYQVINQEFLMHEAGDCRYVNREQDLGIQGMRNAKMSYNPSGFVRKYTVVKRR